jgi:hypothetical protein
LHDERAAPLHDERLDGDPLIVAQDGLWSGQLLEDGLSLLAGCRHGPIVPGRSDVLEAEAASQGRAEVVRPVIARRDQVVDVAEAGLAVGVGKAEAAARAVVPERRI